MPMVLDVVSTSGVGDLGCRSSKLSSLGLAATAVPSARPRPPAWHQPGMRIQMQSRIVFVGARATRAPFRAWLCIEVIRICVPPGGGAQWHTPRQLGAARLSGCAAPLFQATAPP